MIKTLISLVANAGASCGCCQAYGRNMEKKMNREIKFKAFIEVKEGQKHYDTQEIKLINGKVFEVSDIYWYNGKIHYICSKDQDDRFYTIFADHCNIKLLQYTGLKDKNNKDVYEGDIVYTFGEKCIISWHKGKWILNKVNKSDYECLLNDCLAKRKNKQYYSDCIEVVGNIYENKELLEDGNVRN